MWFTILHCDSITAHMQSVAIVLGPHACDPWEMAGGQFGVISECIICICIRCSNFLCYKLSLFMHQLTMQTPPGSLMLHRRPSVAGSWHNLPLTSTYTTFALS